MTIYNIVFILLIFAAIVEAVLWYRNSLQTCNLTNTSISIRRSKARKAKIFLFAEMFALCLISALRASSVGTDMATYIPRYEIIANSTWKELKALADSWNFEFGFVLFCKFVSLFNPIDVQIFTVVTSIIFTIGFYLFIKEFSLLPQLSLLIFVAYGYWTNSFNTVRQYLAISLLLIALILWRKNKTSTKIGAIILSITAISFHVSTICFVILYFIKNKSVSERAYLIVLVIALLIFLIPKSLIERLLASTPYIKYINRQGSVGSTLIVLLCSYLFVFVQRKQISRIDKNAALWFWMFSISILANVFALKIGLFERIMRIFLVSLLTYIPNTIFSLRKDCLGLSVYLTTILLFSLYFYVVLMISQESSGYAIPYIPYWK